MAAPARTEPNPNAKEPEAPAQNAAQAGKAAAGGGGFKAWLPLIITVTVMPLLAFAMTQFYMVPQLKKSLGAPVAARATDAPAAEPSKENAAAGESVVMNKLLVNVAGTMASRFLQVSLSVSGSDANFKAKMEKLDPRLRDLATQVLRTKTLADLEKPDACNLIRAELIAGFNRILGGAMVQEIYFTEFAIQ